jgi:NAD(P)H-dependent FMN reductase
MLNLEIIITSTRPGRAGLPIGKWFEEFAKKDARFNVSVADLAEINLPFMDEPNHPRFQQYIQDHTKAWSARIARADVFVIILPEYNFSLPPALVNAVDYLLNEWKYKAAGFVSYGGVSGGTRSAQMAKQLLTAVSIMPIYEAVTLAFFNQYMKEDIFTPNEITEKAATAMLNELFKWGEALKPLRQQS